MFKASGTEQNRDGETKAHRKNNSASPAGLKGFGE